MIFRRIWRSSLADRELHGVDGVTSEKDAVLTPRLPEARRALACSTDAELRTPLGQRVYCNGRVAPSRSSLPREVPPGLGGVESQSDTRRY